MSYKDKNKKKLNQAKYAASPKGRAANNRKVQKHNQKHPEQVIARHALSHAIASGREVRPSSCSVCHTPCLKPQGHHPDYSKPKTWFFVCPVCHEFFDAFRRWQDSLKS